MIGMDGRNKSMFTAVSENRYTFLTSKAKNRLTVPING